MLMPDSFHDDNFLSAVYRTATLSGRSHPEQLSDLLRIGCEHLGMDIGLVTHITDDQCKIISSWESDSRLFSIGDSLPIDKVVCARTLTCEGVYILNGRDPQAMAGLEEPLEFLYYMGIAIRINGEVFGTLCFFRTQEHPPSIDRISHDEVGVLMLIVAALIERKLHLESEQRYALAAIGSNDGLWDWDIRGGEIYFSPRWKQIMGYREDEQLHDISAWTDRIHHADVAQFNADLSLHLAGQTDKLNNKHRILTADGEERWVHCRAMVVRSPKDGAVRIAGSLTDISEQKKAESDLIQQAHYDKLTGLPNRAMFTEMLRNALNRHKRNPNYQFAVLFLDFDRFKVINDSLGHEYGDMLLVHIADKLRKELRAVDTAARLGGDEFVILLDAIHELRDAIEVANRLLAAFSAPHHLGEHEVISTASIGIVTSESEYARSEDLIRDADIAMYQAKAAGRGRYVVFDEEMHAKAMERLNLERDLRRAVEADQLRLSYQPIVSLVDGKLQGFEALVRWEHPKLGRIRPDKFIQVAEETGEIVGLGNWVLEQACTQLREWKQSHPQAATLYMNVNVSKRQLSQPNVVSELSRIIKSTGIDPCDLKLEITESVIMDDRHGITPVLDEIRSFGVRLAMDDFGTGHSSLSCLHSFPIDVLKIDRAFIRNMEMRIEYSAVVQAIVTLAHTLGITVVAEGLETAEQVAQLQALECDHAQGYYFARPLSADQAEAYLLNQPHRKKSA
ncbi:MAG: GGDEF domain-containing phosphodiesterase [Phycisphaeraceae bacterium]